MQQLFIDFETYYDDAYSLRSMTYVEYLKDDRFACRGASVILNNEEPKWIEAQDLPEYFKQIDWDDTEVIAHNTMFDGTVLAWYYGVTPARWGDTASMANYVFDVPSVSLANVAKLLDLRSKGDALEATKGKENLTAEEAAALADYALDDIIICRDAYVKMKPFMPQAELDLIDMTMRMYLEPKLVLDTPLLTDYLTELAETNEERLLDWSETVAACLPAEYVEWFRDNGRTVFTSNKLFRELLEALGVDIPLKQKRATEHQAKQSVNRINKAKAEIERLERLIEEDKPRLAQDDPEKRAPAEKRTASRLTKLEEARRVAAEKPLKKGAVVYVPALAKNDEAFIEMADTDDEGLSAAASARLQLMSTINESRGRRLVDMAQRMGGRVPVPLKYCGARTNRWSGTQKINMQNLPARGRDRTLRNALTAPPGYKIIAADLAQIEPRVLAWLAGEQFLLDSFASGRDFYTALYVKTFGGDYDEMYTGYKAEDFEWTQKRNIGKACIAEGQLVLTDDGLIPIEKVTRDHLLWDGIEWVSHMGVIYKDEKEVITYDGLTATPDHVVFTADGREIPFGQAASEMVGIEQTGFGRTAIRVNRSYLAGCDSAEWTTDDTRQVSRIGGEQASELGRVACGQDANVLSQWPGTCSERRSFGTQVRCYHSEMQQPGLSHLHKLRSAWDSLRVRVSDAVHSLLPRAFTSPRLQGSGDRQDRQQRELRHWKSTAVDTAREYAQQKKLRANRSRWEDCSCTRPTASVSTAEDGKVSCIRTIFSTDSRARYTGCTTEAQELDGHKRTARVYDIMFAGPRNRFTVEGKLVHNCGLGLGFGMGAPAFRSFAKTAAKQNLTEEEAERIVKAYRDGVPNIVAFWDNCGAMLPAMSSNPMLNSLINRCRFRKGAVILPSGRFLRYDDLRSEEVIILDDEGEIKERRKQWMYGASGYRSYIYSGKMVENLVQAFARDVVADMAIKVQSILDKRDNEGVVLLVHDEVVLVVRESRAESVAEQVKSIMSTTPEYAPGLPLNCSIKIADNYGEAK